MTYFRCSGSSTLDGLTDVDISSLTNGQILKYNSTTQKWENANESGGGSQRTYLGQLIPRVSAADSHITSSGKTTYSGGDNWHAFDGVESTSGIGNCWAADENNTSAYIQYHFDSPYYFTQLILKLYSHYSGVWTGNLNVLGSNDGVMWTNISSTGQAVSVTAPLNTMNTETIDLDDTDTWEYIRIQADGQAFNIAYQPVCDFGEIYVYGGEEVSGGSSAEEMTLSEYNALTTDQKNDGTIRFIPENPYGIITDVDMSTITNLSEGDITVTPSVDEIEIDFNHNVSTNIGGTFYISAPVDVTNYDYIKYDLTTGVCYNSLHSDTNPLRNLGIGLCQTAPSSWQYCPNITWVVSNIYDVNDVNSTFADEIIDVSALTGQYYFVVAFVAWEASISNIKLATAGGYPSQIKYMDKTYGIGSGSDSNIVIVSRTDNTNGYAWLTPCDSNGNPLKPSEVTLLSIFAEADMSGAPPYYNGLNVCVDTDSDRYFCKLYNTQTGGYASDGTYSVDYTVAYISNSGGSSGGSSSHTYSTTEQKVGTWIDGSDVYEKSYQISLPSSYDASNAWIVETDGSFIESILSFEGTIKTSNGLIMSAGSNAPGWHFTLHRNGNNQLVLQSGNGNELMNGTAYVTIRYTKVSTS